RGFRRGVSMRGAGRGAAMSSRRGRGGRFVSPPPRRDVEDLRLGTHFDTPEQQAAHEAALKKRNVLLNVFGQVETAQDFQAALRMGAERLERRGYRIDRVATPENNCWRLYDSDGTEITLESLKPARKST